MCVRARACVCVCVCVCVGGGGGGGMGRDGCVCVGGGGGGGYNLFPVCSQWIDSCLHETWEENHCSFFAEFMTTNVLCAIEWLTATQIRIECAIRSVENCDWLCDWLNVETNSF